MISHAWATVSLWGNTAVQLYNAHLNHRMDRARRRVPRVKRSSVRVGRGSRALAVRAGRCQCRRVFVVGPSFGFKARAVGTGRRARARLARQRVLALALTAGRGYRAAVARLNFAGTKHCIVGPRSLASGFESLCCAPPPRSVLPSSRTDVQRMPPEGRARRASGCAPRANMTRRLASVKL